MRTLPLSLAAASLLLAVAAIASPVAHRRASAAGSAPAHRAAAGAPRHGDGLDADTLAWVGDRAITALDLVQRVEFMPFAGKNSGANMDSVKSHALRALVAEALLAGEAERSVVPAPLARTRAALGRALTRDALYRDLAAGAPPPTPAEITGLARRMHPEASASQLPAWRRAAADSLRELAGQRRASEFLVSHLAGQRVEVDSTAFMRLAGALRTITAENHASKAADGSTIVPSEAPSLLATRLADHLDDVFARLPAGPLSLGDAIEDMRFYLFAVHSLEPRHFDAELSRQFRLLIQGEMMAREALRQHLDQRPDVRHDLRTWTDAWRAQTMLDTLARTAPASDDEAFRTLARSDRERAAAICEVDVQEILCGSLAEAQGVRAALEAGASFDSLARQRSRRSEWIARGGRSGWFTVAEHPALGLAALESPLHSLMGPLRLPEGMSIARVLGRRLRADSLTAGDDLERARKIATGERRSDQIARHVGALANRTHLRFADHALRDVDVIAFNMVVRRTLGFGGGMTACPSLPPIWDWPRHWSGPLAPLP